MNPLTPFLLALVTAVIIFALGFYAGSQPAAAPQQAQLPAAPPIAVWQNREDAVDNLRALRGELETDGNYGRIEALLLFDVCSYLGFDPGEIQAVIGVAWFDSIEEPADLDLEDA